MTASMALRNGSESNHEEFAPLTESQLGLLVVHRAVSVAQLYNVVFEIELDPSYPAETIRAAVADVLTAQPALRMGLKETPQPHALLGEPWTSRTVPVRAAQAPAPDFEAHKRSLCTELASTAFELDSPPLLCGVHLHATDGARSVLLLAVHHTVFDGFSLRPFINDLDAALRGGLDTESLRPRRERALRKELLAQVDAAAGPAVDAGAATAAELLQRTPATVLYPRPNRPPTTDFAGERRELRLTEQESGQVSETCARLDITPFTFFSALYAAVLGRHSGNDAVVFGSPLMARRTVAAHDLCGFFVNTLPLTVDVPWNVAFDEYVHEIVTPAVTWAKTNVAIPFNRIVRHADPDRASNRNPLFSCMLAMQDSTEADSGSAVRGLREHGTGTAKFDLWLGVTPTRHGWLLELEYDSELLPAAVVDDLAGSLRGALRKVAGDTGLRLAELFEDASAEETQKTDGYWRRPVEPGLDGWLRHGLTVGLDAVAVEEHGRRLSYRQLGAAVSAMASRLRNHGITPGDTVGMSTTTLVDTVVTILAALRLRAIYLPVDLDQPADRLSYMLAKAECRLVVGDAGLDSVATVAPVDAHGVEPSLVISGDFTGNPENDGVYIMFTSGSTGKPKGVLMNNGPLVNLTAWQLDALDMGPSTRFLQYAPCGFDVSFQEILPTLIAGGTIVSRQPVDRRDFPALVSHVRELAVTHVYLPVAALQPFVQAAMAAGERFDQLTHLCVSGEQLTVSAEMRRFFAERPHIQMINLYGPTETHAVTTHRLTARCSESWESHVPIGRPITGVTAQVVDRTGHLAPRGVAGDLLLGGRCPARGYVNDAERSAERFVTDPYLAPEGRRYRTGDQAMWTGDGVLLFLGRDDEQVKIRGFRVELGEIEAIAQDHPGVRQAVAAVAGEAAGRHLLLFITLDGEAPVVADEVRRSLSDRLPAHMVPARVLMVDTIPTTANGKIDRASLVSAADRAADDSSRHEGEGPAKLADDPVQAWLQRMWTELLDGTLPAVDRSLLAAGAHSLNVLTALSRVEQEWGVELTILDFFHDPTVAAMAEAIRAQGAN